MEAIGQALAQMDLDVAGLQEAFRDSDRKRLLAGAAQGGLVHSHYVPSGTYGSGLFLMSRFPIEETGFLPFSLNGRPQDLLRPDYYAGKGVSRTRLRTPMGAVDVYNTHLIAQYLEIGGDVYHAHRVLQAYELAQYIRSHSADAPAILTCDLNSTPASLVYRICLGLGGLYDSFQVANPGKPCITATVDNPYIRVHEPECLDYVFCRHSPDRTWAPLSSEVILRDVAPGFSQEIKAYSDHYGILTTFTLAASEPSQPLRPDATVDLDKVRLALQQGLGDAEAARLNSGWRTGVFLAITASALAAQSKLRIARRAFLRVLARSVALLCLVIGGVTLSAVFGLSKEAQILRRALTELDSLTGAAIQQNVENQPTPRPSPNDCGAS
jgi:endonuclease/exonuclease/phosphatase family metal-dependent hydrolase